MALNSQLCCQMDHSGEVMGTEANEQPCVNMSILFPFVRVRIVCNRGEFEW